LTGGGEGTQQQEQASTDGAATSPSLDANVAPAASADQTYASHEMSDSQAPMEAQAAEQQSAQVDANNEQRSASELDAAAPETTSSGTDSFYASAQPPTPEVEQVTSTPPSELPQKSVASWDQHTDSSPSYQEEEKPMPVKKSKKMAKNKKHDKKIAKHSKKSKKEIAKLSKKSKKALAKKSKVDCKKVAKHTKKSSKREIAMCKAEIKKVAKAKKSGKTGKVAQAVCQCNYR
jgi:hypothetical protein